MKRFGFEPRFVVFEGFDSGATIALVFPERPKRFPCGAILPASVDGRMGMICADEFREEYGFLPPPGEIVEFSGSCAR